MRRRLTFIAVWGLGCIAACVGAVSLVVFMNGPMSWLATIIIVGLPTTGLLLALLGLLPGTRPAEEIFVRVLPPGVCSMQRLQAVRIKPGFYRIITPNSGNEPWEFTTGDIVECTERELPMAGGDSSRSSEYKLATFSLSTKNLLHGAGTLLYSAFRFPGPGREFSLTINRQLFFVWLDNAFAFD